MFSFIHLQVRSKNFRTISANKKKDNWPGERIDVLLQVTAPTSGKEYYSQLL
jgi:hypothetical protein